MLDNRSPRTLTRLALMAVALWLLYAPAAMAKLTLPSFFSEHMVLQRDDSARIWGWADPGAKVTVTFADTTRTATADQQGEWHVPLDPRKACSEGRDLKVTDGTDSITVHDVLIGEVWFASGQSNMAFVVRGSQDAEHEIAAADHPGIRMFLAKQTPAAKPQSNIDGQWQVCSPKTVGSFSAVAYFFALHLHQELGVPIGIIKSAWGGKPCETFTSRQALASVPAGKAMLEKLDAAAAAYDPDVARSRYEKAMARWKESTEKARQANRSRPRAERKRLPRKPAAPKNPLEKEGQPAVLYNGMIQPFVGYTMQGAIWYQGEANAKPGKAELYKVMFPLMIRDWREHWGKPFSFYFVQLANYRKPTTEAGVVSGWATVQDAQRLTLALPNTGMAVINDIGEAGNIHPKNKKTVGKRLALWALAKDYNQNIVYSGPLYSSHRVEGTKVRVEFQNVGGGLKSRDGKPLARFEIAGQDQQWHWAEAVIDGNSVVVSCSAVPQPVAVRYAWADNPEGANLVNVEGLPTSVFQTAR